MLSSTELEIRFVARRADLEKRAFSQRKTRIFGMSLFLHKLQCRWPTTRKGLRASEEQRTKIVEKPSSFAPAFRVRFTPVSDPKIVRKSIDFGGARGVADGPSIGRASERVPATPERPPKRSGNVLGAFLGDLGASQGRPGAIWRSPGRILGRPGAVRGRPGDALECPRECLGTPWDAPKRPGSDFCSICCRFESLRALSER